MLYQEKPKELKRLEALYIDTDTRQDDVIKWVASHNPKDLLLHFTLTSGFLCVDNRTIREEMYLIRENGRYRLLDKEVFEGMYEPIPNETA